MSWPLVNAVMNTKRPRWGRNAQLERLLRLWAKRYRPDWGYGLWASRDLEEELGVKHGQINRLTRQLELLGVGGRLPMPHDRIGDFNRYIVYPEAFEDRRHDCRVDARGKRRGAGAGCLQCVGSPIADIDGQVIERRGTYVPIADVAPVERAPLFEVGLGLNDQGADPQGSGGADPKGSGGLILNDQPSNTSTDLRTQHSYIQYENGRAQARLHALVHDVSDRKNYALATAPQDDGNYAAVARAVRDVLADPTYADRLTLKAYDPASDRDVCELARRLCDRRHVLTGKHPKVKWDVIGRALASERAKQAIARGAARGRDAAQAMRETMVAAARRRVRGLH